MHSIKLGPNLYTYQGLRATGLYIRGLCHLVNILTSTRYIYQDCDTDKTNVCTKEKS